MKFEIKFLSYLFIFLCCLFFINNDLMPQENKIVAKIGSEEISLGDFETQMLKGYNNNKDSVRKCGLQEKKDFLNLLIAFRLKVLEAKSKGFLDSADIQNEISEFKNTYIPNYIIDKKLIEPQIFKLYELRKEEVRASHIMIKLPKNTEPEDTIAAYQRLEEVYKRLENGEDFGKVAMEMSDDPTAKENGGDIYYFTGGMTVPEFEDAVYSLQIGEYTKNPIRSVYGLHIAKLTDRKPRVESIRAAHILKQFTIDSTGAVVDSSKTYDEIYSLYERLKNGEDFDKLAEENSDDIGTSKNGGDLGYFERRRMVKEFDSVAFTLKEGEISKPVRTPFGLHIIKLLEIKEYPPYESQKENMSNEFRRSFIFQNKLDEFTAKLRDKYKFTVIQDGFNLFISKFDSTKHISAQNMDSLFNDEELYVVVANYDGGELPVKDVKSYIERKQEYGGYIANYQSLYAIVNHAADYPILFLEASGEDVETNETFKKILSDLTDGILRFKIDEEIISRGHKVNDNEILEYYNNNKDNFIDKTDTSTVQRSLEEVKFEIMNILQQEKSKESEELYIFELKEKYPVIIYEDVLKQAFAEEK